MFEQRDASVRVASLYIKNIGEQWPLNQPRLSCILLIEHHVIIEARDLHALARTGATFVPAAVPVQRFLELHVAAAPGSGWRHVLSVLCPNSITAASPQLSVLPQAHIFTCAKICFPHCCTKTKTGFEMTIFHIPNCKVQLVISTRSEFQVVVACNVFALRF